MRSSLSSICILILVAVGSAGLIGCGPGVEPVILDPSAVYLDARTKLLQEVHSKNDVVRMQAIEAIAVTLGQREAAVITEALKDPNPAIRFAAAMAIGDIVYLPAKDDLLRMAADKKFEPNKLVFCAVIYALFQFDNIDYTHELGNLLFDPEKEVRATTAMVMGKIGETSALVPLKRQYSQEQDPTVRLRLVEAMTILGDERSASLLEAYTKSQFMDERLDAIRAMEQAPPARAAFALRDMLKDRQSPFVRIAAAGALAEHGELTETNFIMCVDAAVEPEKVLARHVGGFEQVTSAQASALKQLAARSLGLMDFDPALSVLEPLLKDSNGGVRVAAAMSILKILDDYHEDIRSPDLQATPAKTVEPSAQSKDELFTAGGKD